MVSFYLLRSEKPWRVWSGTENVEDMSSVTGFESKELALGPGTEEQMWPERSREGWGRNEPWRGGSGDPRGLLSGEIQLTSLAAEPTGAKAQERKRTGIFQNCVSFHLSTCRVGRHQGRAEMKLGEATWWPC